MLVSGRVHPWKLHHWRLTWNIIMEVDGRSCSFSKNGWFICRFQPFISREVKHVPLPKKTGTISKKNGLSSNHFLLHPDIYVFFGGGKSPAKPLGNLRLAETMRNGNPSGSPKKCDLPKWWFAETWWWNSQGHMTSPIWWVFHDVFNGDESQSQGMKNP